LTFLLCFTLGANQISLKKGPIDSIKSRLRTFAMTGQPAGENQERDSNNYGFGGFGGPWPPLEETPPPATVPVPTHPRFILNIINAKRLLGLGEPG